MCTTCDCTLDIEFFCVIRYHITNAVLTCLYVCFVGFCLKVRKGQRCIQVTSGGNRGPLPVSHPYTPLAGKLYPAIMVNQDSTVTKYFHWPGRASSTRNALRPKKKSYLLIVTRPHRLSQDLSNQSFGQAVS